MADQDYFKKREENDADREFQKSAKIKFISDEMLSGYFVKMKSQWGVLFWLNVVVCFCAAIAILIGVFMALGGETEAGIVFSVVGALMEVLSNIFIRQYENARKKVSDEYFRFLMCNNLEQALNLAIKLPITDARDSELRYLEIRELLRPIKDGFNEYLSKSK